MKNGITVTAVGEATAAPDRALISLASSVVRADPQAAMEAVSERIEGLMTKLDELGVNRASVQTADLSLWPESDRQGAPAGYRARHHLRIRLDEVEQASAIIAASLSVLGEGTEFGGINFDLKDPNATATEARATAWTNIRVKATELARLAGVELGRPVSIEEYLGGQGPNPIDLGIMADVPVVAGTTSVRVILTVRFALVG